MHPLCNRKGPQEVKLSTADREKLSLLFTLLVRPKELQLSQAKIANTHPKWHEPIKANALTLGVHRQISDVTNPKESKESKKRTCEDAKLRVQGATTLHASTETSSSCGLLLKPAKKKNRTEMM